MSEAVIPPKRSLRQGVLAGSFWGFALRWCVRLAGLVSTIVLARLLEPDDFGVVAIALLVVTALEVLGQSGQRLAVIRFAEATSEDHDTAWTLSVLSGAVIGVATLVSAPLATVLFHEPRAQPVIALLSLRSLLTGFESMGATLYRRQLEFRREFFVLGTQRLITFVLTIVLAITLRNYWALAIGTVLGAACSTFLSFLLHPYRPRFRLTRLRRFWGFSSWMLAKQLGSFFVTKLDHILVGIVSTAGGLAQYTVANDLASTIIEEIRAPITASLYPVLAPHQGDRRLIARTFLVIFGVITTVAVATSVGIDLVARDVVLVALGTSWLPAVPLLAWLGLAAGVFSIGALAFSIFELLGRADLSAKLTWLNLFLIAGAMLSAAFLSRDLVIIAAVRFAAFALYSLILLAAVLRLLPIGWRDLALWTWRPVLAGGVMAAVVDGAQAYLVDPGIVRLLVLCSLGAVVYLAVLFGSWVAAGRPDGPEALAIELCRNYGRTIRRRRSRRDMAAGGEARVDSRAEREVCRELADGRLR